MAKLFMKDSVGIQRLVFSKDGERNLHPAAAKAVTASGSGLNKSVQGQAGSVVFSNPDNQ